jgi:hypothetical protein
LRRQASQFIPQAPVGIRYLVTSGEVVLLLALFLSLANLASLLQLKQLSIVLMTIF